MQARQRLVAKGLPADVSETELRALLSQFGTVSFHAPRFFSFAEEGAHEKLLATDVQLGGRSVKFVVHDPSLKKPKKTTAKKSDVEQSKTEEPVQLAKQVTVAKAKQKDVFRCEPCDRRFNSKVQLVEHLEGATHKKTAGGDKQRASLFCDFCGVQTESLDEFGRHVDTESHRVTTRRAREAEEKKNGMAPAPAKAGHKKKAPKKAAVKSEKSAASSSVASAPAPSEEKQPLLATVACRACGAGNVAHFRWCALCGASVSVIAPPSPAKQIVSSDVANSSGSSAGLVDSDVNNSVMKNLNLNSKGEVAVDVLLERANLEMYLEAFSQAGISDIRNVLGSEVFESMKPFHKKKLEAMIKLLLA